MPFVQQEKRLERAAKPLCYHCGEICPDQELVADGYNFCCHGCKAVYQFLTENQLDGYYQPGEAIGLRPTGEEAQERFAYLDDPLVQERLLDFKDERQGLLTMSIPSIHCSSCIYLLEKLYQLEPAVTESVVNFPKREVRIKFDHQIISLRRLVELLTRLGYEPRFQLSSLSDWKNGDDRKSLYQKVGLAAFSFANIMLFSFPEYLGLADSYLASFFGYFNMLLALPVLLFSANSYFKAAYRSLIRGKIGIDLPIALGIATLFARSTYEIIWSVGPGYFDSLAGLVFFLLLGRLFQQKTYDRMTFDSDYRSYFPIAVQVKTATGISSKPLNQISVGDRLIIRHQELVPADSHLIEGLATIDYSFVTGESKPTEVKIGDMLYAGGRQLGGAIEVEVVKEISASYLTSLWNSSLFNQTDDSIQSSLIDRIAQGFTPVILMIASAAGLYWYQFSIAEAIKAFTAVLIVACPCALALAAPFAYGTVMRLMGRMGLYIKNIQVAERMARIEMVIFDKTGTLTPSNRNVTDFVGEPLSLEEKSMIASLAAQSTHPLSRSIAAELKGKQASLVKSFQERPGVGIDGIISGHQLKLGRLDWVDNSQPHAVDNRDKSRVAVSIDNLYRGSFFIEKGYRASIDKLIASLNQKYSLAVLSGDTNQEQSSLEKLFGKDADIRFQQSPHDKLNRISKLQSTGRRILMVGDGLNDAGALKAAEVGIALTEDTAAFSPACDAIIEASNIGRLESILRLAKIGNNVIIASVIISFIYNIVGLSLAVSGNLSPLVAAILMPLSSITVVSFATVSVRMLAKRRKITGTI